MEQKEIRGGVFGFGGMGQAFTKAINSGEFGKEFRIVGACNRGEAKRRLAQEQYGLAAYQNPRRLIELGIDFGLVASTTVAHYEQVCLLAEAGIPIFCEKPISLNLEQGRRMVELVDQRKLPSTVNFLLRTDPRHRKIKEMADKGEFGRLVLASSFKNRGHGFFSEGHRHRAVVEPEESGGWIVHHACHQVDLLCWFLGQVDSVRVSSRSTVKGIETVEGLSSEEAVIGMLSFKNGAIGTVMDCVGGVRDSHLSITGTRCSVSAFDHRDRPVLKAKYEGDPEWGEPRIIDPTRDFPPESNLGHFLKVVRDGIPPTTTIGDAYDSLKVTLAMRESARRQGEAVAISEFD